MQKIITFLVLSLLALSAGAAAQDYIPDELRGWQKWVLKDREYRDCPFYFNRGAADRDDFLCAWPGALKLDATATGARFSQQWTVHGKDQWVSLPGSSEHWPDRVLANDRPVEVIARQNVPGIRLSPGNWNITGRFAWDERPGVLPVPAESGLLELTWNGRTVERPSLDRNGVFLGERERETRAVDAVRTVVYRLVADDIPTRLVTEMQIDISGAVREEQFGPILPEGFVPMSLQSALPAKIEADGVLRVQVRPGRWTVRITARAGAVADTITANSAGSNMPDSEIWSYQVNNRLRVTAIEGLPPVDPVQVEVPGMWQTYPAFRVDTDAVFSVTERSRGVISQRNELTLDRTMWLDFDGDGFIVEDQIGGEMRTGWRLDMKPPYNLLAASANGDEDLLITTVEGEEATGIEVRNTRLVLETLGRSETRDAMPVTGWDERFASVSARLNLPAGHKLFAAPGVDSARGSWVDQWKLLDFFLVLIVTIAVWRLFNPVSGVIALLALVLSFHEMLAPTWLWLNLLIAIALLRVAPEGRLFKAVRTYQLMSAAALLLVLVPFVAGQIRVALYPQLEPQYDQYRAAELALERPGMRLPQEIRTQPGAVRELSKVGKAEDAAPVLEERIVLATAPYSFARYAPNAIVQAGPGVPSWRRNTVVLEWSGPVEAQQDMRLLVMPRWLVSSLRFIEVGLMLLFAAIVAAEIFGRRWSLPGGLAIGARATTGAVTVALGMSMLLASTPSVAQLPDQQLLQQLEQRLLEPPDCVPRCAEIAAASVQVGADAIAMELTIHAIENIAIPLPGTAAGWRPQTVVVESAQSSRVVRGRGDILWLYVTAGRHVVSLQGSLPPGDTVEIPFPTPPRVVSVDGDGWLVAGIKDRRLQSGSLQLTRAQTSEEGGDTVRWESNRFPPFVHVTRRIRLDLDWLSTTTVERLAPATGAITVEIPLIAGETVVTENMNVEDGTVLVTMGPNDRGVSWSSNLPPQSELILSAPDGTPWKETWRVEVGRIWNVDFSGLPESNVNDENYNKRIAEFDPRSGEELVISATRPAASEGSTLAFDEVNLVVSQGSRSRDVVMTLEYRSTRGEQHVLRLPNRAEVTGVKVDGRELTVRNEDGELTLPILPGSHEVQISWRSDSEIQFRTVTPVVDLRAPASNISLSLQKPRDRWLLGTAGPQLGPAVLYWPELAALVLFALILGRIGLAPLGTVQWLLLGLGFSTFSWGVLGIVVAWLLFCGLREKFGTATLNWMQFQFIQVVTVGFTIFALLAIVIALPQGLLGTPDMHVAGFTTAADALGWFADRSDSMLPQASAYTVPMWGYKLLILAWALWLSFALLRWLPWVWHGFSKDGFWRTQEDDAQ
jgi:hypothetical protein